MILHAIQPEQGRKDYKIMDLIIQITILTTKVGMIARKYREVTKMRRLLVKVEKPSFSVSLGVIFSFYRTCSLKQFCLGLSECTRVQQSLHNNEIVRCYSTWFSYLELKTHKWKPGRVNKLTRQFANHGVCTKGSLKWVII